MKKIFGLMFFLSLVTISLQAQKPVVYCDSINVNAEQKDLLFVSVQNWIKDNYSNKYTERYEMNGDGWRNMPTLIVKTKQYELSLEFPTDSKILCVFTDLRKEKNTALNYKPILNKLIQAINSGENL
jgi:hypothetical protein